MRTTSSNALITLFLRQIADLPYVPASPTYAYATSVIAPEMHWPEESFLDALCKDLALPVNVRALGNAQKLRSTGRNAPLVLTLSTPDGAKQQFQCFPRPAGTVEDPDAMTMVITPLLPIFSASHIANEAMLRFLDVLPVYVLIIDKHYRIRYSNEVARETFGSCDRALCYAALHKRTAPCFTCPPFRLLTDKLVKVHEWYNEQRKAAFRSHSYPFYSEDGDLLILQIGMDITAGVKARQALDLSEQRYQSIAENLTIGLALVALDSTIVTVNPQMRQWFGPNAHQGIKFASLLDTAVCEKNTEESLFATVIRTKSNQEREFPMIVHSGEERHFRCIACPILFRNKTVRAIVILLEDVTERNNMAARMAKIERLEALGSLAGGIAHEINQPLSALHLYASGLQILLEQHAVPAEQVQERLGLILNQADKIRQIISHMRALVMQEEAPALEFVRYADAVNDALGLVGAQLLDHTINVAVSIPDTLPAVRANSVQLEQVIINLLVNAMHALDSLPSEPPEGKHITFSVSCCGTAALTLHITDNGPGLGSLHPKIFDPFFTTKEQHKGMGLGLSIVHAFVSSWGGTVEAADNASGGGATFSVTLPLAEPKDTAQ